LIALVIGGSVSLVFSDQILAFLLRPLHDLSGTVRLANLTPLSMVMVRLYIAIIVGLMVGLPVIVYQLWAFVSPGLHSHERGAIPWVILSTFLLFVAGAFLSYSIMPYLFRVLVEAGYEGVENIWNIRDYFGFLLGFMAAFGLVFEMPVAIYILSVVGIVTPGGLRRSRRYAVVLIFVVAAVLTPSPDPFSQIAMALPLLVLFEISILVSAIVERRKRRKRMLDADTALP
jgi:sec-independent protein translocase protein TatC